MTARRLQALVVLCLGALNASCSPEGRGPMTPEIRYSSTVAEETLPLTLSIKPDGDVTLTVRSNRDDPASPTIGVFKQRLTSADLAALVTALRSPDFGNLPNPESVSPGSAVREIGVREGDQKEIVKYAADSEPAAPAFVSAEARVMDLIRKVRGHPTTVLAMKAEGFPAQCKRGEKVAFTLIFSNVGSEAIQMTHPSAWADEGVEARLTGLRSDVSLADLRDHHQRSEELSMAAVSGIRPPGAMPPRVSLAPGDRLEISFRPALDWPPGRYGVEVSCLSSLQDGRGEDLLQGEIVTGKFTLQVTGKPKPGDEPADLGANDEFEEEDADS